MRKGSLLIVLLLLTLISIATNFYVKKIISVLIWGFTAQSASEKQNTCCIRIVQPHSVAIRLICVNQIVKNLASSWSPVARSDYNYIFKS